MINFLKIITIFCMIILCGCKDEELSLKRTPYTGNELRIDGYYYRKIPDLEIRFFYRNGIVRYGGGGYSSFEELDNCILNHQIVDGSSKTDWGVFLINGNTIKFEMWYPPSGGGTPTYIREGEILNDTTFHITESYRSDGSERSEKNEMYHFRQFYPKPDSTNKFIN